MAINIDRLLVEQATRVTTTRDENGDYKFGGSVSVPCLYRDLKSLNRFSNHEERDADGTLFFNAAEASYAKTGAIYYHPDEGYLKIIRRTRAKRLVIDDTTQFIKCAVQHIRQIS